MSVNKAILIGNLGQDPELRTTGGGTPVCTLRIATNDRRKDKDGNWQDHTEWHSIVLFGKNAENASRYLKKGRQIYIEGRIQTRKWQDKEGNDRYTTEVVGDQMRFIGGGGGGTDNRYDTVDPGQSRETGRRASEPDPDRGREDVNPYADDDIPF